MLNSPFFENFDSVVVCRHVPTITELGVNIWRGLGGTKPVSYVCLPGRKAGEGGESHG